MKLNYTTANGRINVGFEGNSAKDLFGQIAEFQEIFDVSTCGKCGSDDLRFVKRTVDGNDYYELRCNKCGAKLLFGANKDGKGLFPKRKGDDGKYLPDGGWVKWDNDSKGYV